MALVDQMYPTVYVMIANEDDPRGSIVRVLADHVDATRIGNAAYPGKYRIVKTSLEGVDFPSLQIADKLYDMHREDLEYFLEDEEESH